MARTRTALKLPPTSDAPVSPSSDSPQAGGSSDGMQGAGLKRRRQVGNDRIIIAADFNAPLSPEEAALFGL